MDRLDELATFLAILDTGSLAAAGRRLRRSPPAVTRSLAGLEQRLGLRLLERTTRRLKPTDAGRRFAEQARGLLTGYDALVAEAAGAADAPSGLLRVTAPVVFGRKHVAPIVGGFLGLFPAVRVELVLSDRNLDLIEESLDAAVRIGRLADSALMVRQVGAVRRVLVASPAYLAARGTPERVEDLAAHDTILAASRPAPPEWRFRAGDGRRERVARLAPRLIANDIEAALTVARVGGGIASALSYQVAEDVASGSLVRLLAAHEPPPLPVQLVMPNTRYRAPRVRAFLDYAASALGAVQALHEEDRR